MLSTPSRAIAPRLGAVVLCLALVGGCASPGKPSLIDLSQASASAEALTPEERAELARLTDYAEVEAVVIGGAAVIGAVALGVLARDARGLALGASVGGLYGGMLGAALDGDGGAYADAWNAAVAEGRTEQEAEEIAIRAAVDAARAGRVTARGARERVDAALAEGAATADEETLRTARARAVLIDGLAAAMQLDVERLRRDARARPWAEDRLLTAARAIEMEARRTADAGAAVAAALVDTSQAPRAVVDG